MSTARTAYRIHSWTGLLTGWLLFVLCLTGTLVVYKYPLKALSNPEMTPVVAVQDIGPDRALAHFRVAYPEHRVSVVAFPADTYSIGQYSIMAFKPEGGRKRFWIDAATGDIRPELQSDFADFVQRLHATFYLGNTPGRTLVGVMGVLMLVSLISGLVFHWRRLSKDLWHLRLGAPLRKAWSDVHKVVGVWTLPFALVIAITGAWLGLETVIKIPAERQSPLVRAGEGFAPSLAIADLVERSRIIRPDFKPTHINFEALNQAGSTARVQGDLPGSRLVQRGQTMLVFEADTGEHLQTIDRTQQGLGRYLLASMRPLHYGYFWGWISELLYVFLGTASTLGVAAGMLIWAEREKRRRGGKQAKTTAMERANLAVMGGCILALTVLSVAAFGGPVLGLGFSFSQSQDLLSGKPNAPELLAFFALWVFLGGGLSRCRPVRGWQWVLGVTAGFCLVLPALAVAGHPNPVGLILHPHGMGFLLFTWAIAGGFLALAVRLTASPSDPR